MISPCATCTHQCCHHYTVTITGYDAWVIARALGMAPEQFLVIVEQREPNDRGFLLDQSGSSFDIALDKAPAAQVEKPCIFWFGLPSGVGRCGIYALRPYVCQTYPAFLLRGAVTRREDVLCPTPAWRQGELKQPCWGNRLLEMQVEFSIYTLAVARWNYHARWTGSPESITAPGYFTYLMHFYNRLEPLRSAIGAADWGAFCVSWDIAGRQGTHPFRRCEGEMVRWQGIVDAIMSIATGFFPSDRASEEPVPAWAAPNESRA